MIATGWCVDARGIEAISSADKWGITKDDCFKLCQEDPSVKGCTLSVLDTYLHCITYTGDIKGGSGDISSKCYYRHGISFISFLCFDS